MGEIVTLQHQARALDLAQRVLEELETRAAGYTVLTVPAPLVIEIEEKRKEIEHLTAQIGGRTSVILPNTLPRRDAFFGREREIEAALAALHPSDRSWGVVIDGIGGIGKTALAVEVAYLCQSSGRFDVFLFVSAKQTRLEAGGETPLVETTPTLDALLTMLGREINAPGIAQLSSTEKPRAFSETLRAYSGPQRRVLLILDNLETLAHAEQKVLENLLRQLPQPCKAIVTSRKHIGDGAVWLRLERLSWEAARALIAEEARRAPNLQAILAAVPDSRRQELYDAAGGSPLALRWLLGLMRARNLSLDRALAALRGAEAETLLDFIYREARRDMGSDDWRVLGALALFAAPASAEALAAASGLNRLALESATERLGAYSLVDMLGPDGPYTLHLLTRRMAGDELDGHPTLAHELRLNFARYWVYYAQHYGGYGKDSYKTYDQLDLEWANLEATADVLRILGHCVADPDSPKDERLPIMLVEALRGFMWFRGLWDAAVRLSEWAYQVGLELEDWRIAGWMAHDVGWIHFYRAEIELAAQWAERCAKMMQRGLSRSGRAAAARLRGLIARQMDQYSNAERFLGEALAINRAQGKEGDQAILLNDLGNVAYARQDYERAIEYYRNALAIHERRDEKDYQATVLGNLGELAVDRANLTEARACYERELLLAQEVGRQDLIAHAKHGLAWVMEAEGQSAAALLLAEETLRMREHLRDRNLNATRELVERLRQTLEGRQ